MPDLQVGVFRAHVQVVWMYQVEHLSADGGRSDRAVGEGRDTDHGVWFQQDVVIRQHNVGMISLTGFHDLVEPAREAAGAAEVRLPDITQLVAKDVLRIGKTSAGFDSFS